MKNTDCYLLSTETTHLADNSEMRVVGIGLCPLGWMMPLVSLDTWLNTHVARSYIYKLCCCGSAMKRRDLRMKVERAYVNK